MKYSSKNISYTETNCFSKIVIDYLSGNENLKPFYTFENNINGINEAIESRKKIKVNREVLIEHFNKNYLNVASEKQQQNISSLKKENCFTITTAHQPNIFTGPLYVVYKILHIIKLAETLNKDHKDYHFVPVFFMGSEDADIDELGQINIQNNKLQWQTKQTGAVGRMLVDDHFLKLIKIIESQIAVNPFGAELIQIFSSCYSKGKTIQQATFELINNLFAEWGLLVLMPDDTLLKNTFKAVIKKELTEQFSHKIVENTNTKLSAFYKTQASGRDINLFYLIDDKRERIIFKDNEFFIENLNIKFTKNELMDEVENHSERFSPNVILRPVFQETILPNICFIGGGGELAYWLQLKNVFEAAKVFYPVLILRNSFLIYNNQQADKINQMNLSEADLFLSVDELFTQLVLQQTTNNLSIKKNIENSKKNYVDIANSVKKIDATLENHVLAISTKALHKLEQLEKKILRAEKRKFIHQKNQLQHIKNQLFPNNSLQERVENFSYFYSLYRKNILQCILNSSNSIEQKFCCITIDK